MDLELSDEQVWLAESVDTLLEREREHPWPALVEFGALSVDPDDGLGAVELCLIARAIGAHLASVPFLGSAAVRFAGVSGLDQDSVSIALLEPGRSWSIDAVETSVHAHGLTGEKVAVELASEVERLAVVARTAGEPVLALVDATGVDAVRQAGLDQTLPMSAVSLNGVPAEVVGDAAVVRRVTAVGALLAAAESIGAASVLLDDAKRYASERKQFGRTIGSYQALRHIMADMYVRLTSGWSTVLYAAAALDDELDEAETTTSVAKAYVARGAREVAHGAMQVFGGIAFTDEHPAHRFLRRIVVRERQFGDAAHHEREIGRMLAAQTRGAHEHVAIHGIQ